MLHNAMFIRDFELLLCIDKRQILSVSVTSLTETEKEL